MATTTSNTMSVLAAIAVTVSVMIRAAPLRWKYMQGVAVYVGIVCAMLGLMHSTASRSSSQSNLAMFLVVATLIRSPCDEGEGNSWSSSSGALIMALVAAWVYADTIMGWTSEAEDKKEEDKKVVTAVIFATSFWIMPRILRNVVGNYTTEAEQPSKWVDKAPFASFVQFYEKNPYSTLATSALWGAGSWAAGGAFSGTFSAQYVFTGLPFLTWLHFADVPLFESIPDKMIQGIE